MEVSGQFHAPAALLPGKDPDTCCIEGWVCPRAGLGVMAMAKTKKILTWPYWESNYGP